MLASAFALSIAGTGPAWTASGKAEQEVTRQLNRQAGEAAAHSRAPVADKASANADNTPPAPAPTIAVETAPGGGPALLSSISNPPVKIATATVLDAGGAPLGAVQKVEVTETGTPTRVTVALDGDLGRTVTMEASAVRYDAARNAIITQTPGAAVRAPL
ncbi:MAG: hypothetical protein BGN82_08865 [Alphaproteobacteria bacterium 65-7]|nr:MAG: hypothetical protein BGN82_08865 [Alphaproteobacteria bacterium 65-7]